jgi:hypothetical protein
MSIGALWDMVKAAATILWKFAAAMFLAALIVILYALPWLLRAASILAWLVAGFIGIQTIQAIYAPFSPAIPTLALQFAVILLMVSWAMYSLLKGVQLWGSLFVAGVVISLLSWGAGLLAEHWLYADLFFHVLPSLLLTVGMLTLSMRLRAIYNGKGHRVGRMAQTRSAS